MKVGQYSTVNGTKTFMRNTNNSLLSANIKLPANPTLSTVKKKREPMPKDMVWYPINGRTNVKMIVSIEIASVRR